MGNLKFGVVYGRFQPFHNGHLLYVLESLRQCETLFIGITNPDPIQTKFESTDPQRHLPENNPFTYWQRYLMIKNSLIDIGLDFTKINIVPIPVHNPKIWHHYIPKKAINYRVALSEWDREKIRRLKKSGYKVKILNFKSKDITATMVREKIKNGKSWEELVPQAVVKIIKEYNNI